MEDPAEKLAIETFRPPGDAEYHSSSTGWTGITVDGVNCWQLSVQPASWGNSIRYPVNSWLPDAEGSRLGGAFTFDPHITLLHPRRSWAKTRRSGSLWERAGRGAVSIRPQRSYGQVGQAGGLYRDTHRSGAAQVWCQTDARADRWHNSWIIAWLGSFLYRLSRRKHSASIFNCAQKYTPTCHSCPELRKFV